MFISRRRYEMKLEAARNDGASQAIERRNMDDRFAHLHERITRIERILDGMDDPKTVSGFCSEVTEDA